MIERNQVTGKCWARPPNTLVYNLAIMQRAWKLRAVPLSATPGTAAEESDSIVLIAISQPVLQCCSAAAGPLRLGFLRGGRPATTGTTGTATSQADGIDPLASDLAAEAGRRGSALPISVLESNLRAALTLAVGRAFILRNVRRRGQPGGASAQ